VKWREKCQTLLGEIGGIGTGYTLHTWEDPFKKTTPPSVPTPPSAPASSPPSNTQAAGKKESAGKK